MTVFPSADLPRTYSEPVCENYYTDISASRKGENTIKAIILSGGQGTRLRSVSGDLPKPMMPILGVPLLERTVCLLKENGFTELCITLHYRPELIRAHFGDGSAFGVSIQYRTENTPLGTAGAVRNCADFTDGEPVLVMSGDCACDYDLSSLMASHRGGVTIALSARQEPLSYGLVILGRDSRIMGFLEKPAWEQVVTDRVSTGIYILSPEVISRIPRNRPCDFAKDLFPELLSDGVPMYGRVMEGYWQDIGTPRAYYQCNLDALDGAYKLPERDQSARRVIPCRDRAGLMRLMSEALAEMGADFSDGLTVQNDLGRAHLAPMPGECSLLLDGDPAAVRKMEALIRRLNNGTV